MTSPPTITCQLPHPRLTQVISHLITWCTQVPCAFCYTICPADQHHFTLFPAPPALPIQIGLQGTQENPTLSPADLATDWPAETVHMLQQLVQICQHAR